VYAAVVQSLAGLALLLLVIAGGLLALHATAGGRALLARSVEGQARTLLSIGGLVALTATGGSLYFSEVVGFPPCLLCWYQRIAMYPLVLILGMAGVLGDWRVWRYVLPVAGAGLAVSIYHNVIQHLPQLDVVTCSLDNPCTTRFLAVYGFVSIPFMAGAGFLGIIALTLTARIAGAPRADPLNVAAPPDRASRAP
jgi:disulfide bond formation protein DsbB